MAFVLDQLKKALQLTTEIKQELYDKGNDVDRHELDNKIIATHVYLEFALQEMEWRDALKKKLKKESIIYSLILLAIVLTMLLYKYFFLNK